MLRDVGGRTARGPDDARGRLGAHPGHRALADPAPVGAPRRHARPATTASAPTSTSRFPGRWSTAPWPWPRAPIPTRTPGCPSGRCGRCSRWSSRTSTSPGWRRWPSTSATPRPCTSRSGSPASGTWPTSSTATPCTGPTWCSAGRKATPDEDEALWQVELWRLLRARIGQPSPAERLVDACRAPPGRAGAPGPSAAGCRCSG